MLNLIILVGRLTKEPEIVVTGAKNDHIANFDIAVDNLGKEAGASFFTCKAFNLLADNIQKFCHKGSKVAITGRIQQRTFIRKDGSKGSVYEVIADSVEFLNPKPVEEGYVQSHNPEPEEEENLYDPKTGKPLKPAKK